MSPWESVAAETRGREEQEYMAPRQEWLDYRSGQGGNVTHNADPRIAASALVLNPRTILPRPRRSASLGAECVSGLLP